MGLFDPFEIVPNISLENNLNNKEELVFPIMSSSEEESSEDSIPDEISILPLRNSILFPGIVIPISITSKRAMSLMKDAQENKELIGIVGQIDETNTEVSEKNLYQVGTVAQIVKNLKMPDGSLTIVVQGKRRFKIENFTQKEPHFKAKIQLFEQQDIPQDEEFDALINSIKEIGSKIVGISQTIPQDIISVIKNISSPAFLINFVASSILSKNNNKQEVLEINDIKQRAEKVLGVLYKELQLLELKNKIQSKVKVDIDKQQREYLLTQQLKTIQEELGGDNVDIEIEDFKKKAKKKKWPQNVQEVFDKEINKLQRINPGAADYSSVASYIETLLELPWGEYTKDNLDIIRAKNVLDKNHFGLEKVKERLQEYLSVLKLKKDTKSPILCLVGPPGVGKTSLGRSLAKALNKKYVNMALGGLHDESEIRGHRRTYIGAMPGRIVQLIKKAKYMNPVFVLDEIDKIGNDFRGDPASAFLEVLDPEQNSLFYDNYLELEFDLSKVMFVATANTLNGIHPALLDRMEIIEVNGYTVEEKIQIAKKYLIPKQREENGLKSKDLNLNDKTIEKTVVDYTRESGVRNLNKQIATICRKVAKKITTDVPYKPRITENELASYLGAITFDNEVYEDNEGAGVVPGLAWTQVGGEILFVESVLSLGKGRLTLTGSLGNVMKESASTALAYLKSHATQLDIDYKLFDKLDLHIHVPAGAVPKDGPSAGITMLTSIASVFTQRKVKSRLAMTGEITLRGKVLPVGGIKEKILAAKRANIKEIILSKTNKKDIDEIEKDYISDMQFTYVDTMDSVLTHALLKEKVKNSINFNVL